MILKLLFVQQATTIWFTDIILVKYNILCVNKYTQQNSSIIFIVVYVGNVTFIFARNRNVFEGYVEKSYAIVLQKGIIVRNRYRRFRWHPECT